MSALVAALHLSGTPPGRLLSPTLLLPYLFFKGEARDCACVAGETMRSTKVVPTPPSSPSSPHPLPLPPPQPSECIAALNSPQCLAVSHFQCDVFTSRSRETGTGAFSAAAAGGDHRAATHREGHTQTFRARHRSAGSLRPAAPPPPARRPPQSAPAALWRSCLEVICRPVARNRPPPPPPLFLAGFSPPPGGFSRST